MIIETVKIKCKIKVPVEDHEGFTETWIKEFNGKEGVIVGFNEHSLNGYPTNGPAYLVDIGENKVFGSNEIWVPCQHVIKEEV